MLRKSDSLSITLSVLICCLSWFTTVYANEGQSQDQLEKWYEQEEQNVTESVSEGELRFLLDAPANPVLHALNRLTVLTSSLDDGWIGLSQCYRNLDSVADAEIVFRYKAMRDLKITGFRNIEKAWIEGQSIQLTNVRQQAELCITAMVRIFYQNADGSFSLINGPFHRKFLDGYYPYHLTLEVNYPAARLKLKQTIPPAQPGLVVKNEDGKLVVEGLFEGILNVEVIFLPHM